MIKNVKISLFLVMMLLAGLFLPSGKAAGYSIDVFTNQWTAENSGDDTKNDSSNSVISGGRFYSYTSAGLLIGNGESGFLANPSVTSVAGLSWSRQLYAGMGAGFERYNWSVLPLFGELRYKNKQYERLPMISFRAGYALPLEKTHDGNRYQSTGNTSGGVFFSPGISFRLAGKSGTILMAEVAYQYQEMRLNDVKYIWDAGSSTNIRYYYNRIAIKLGILFY
ncbi:MAG TPA: hypothetical protein PLV51_02850 [Lentimicrobium sp.]|jgi:hypothetical protein|nr:hypothetical protein [Lentimicrobium sp.]